MLSPKILPGYGQDFRGNCLCIRIFPFFSHETISDVSLTSAGAKDGWFLFDSMLTIMMIWDTWLLGDPVPTCWSPKNRGTPKSSILVGLSTIDHFILMISGYPLFF